MMNSGVKEFNDDDDVDDIQIFKWSLKRETNLALVSLFRE